jgi:hypothetical protein
MARGRPASTDPAWECHIHLRLRAGQDDDLIHFLSSLPPRRRALALKVALRSGGMQNGLVIDESPDDELAAAADDFLK